MEELRVIRLADFKGSLSVGLSGAPEVLAAVSAVAYEAEGQFYARLLGVTEARRFFEDLAASEPSAAAFAETSRYGVTRYAYCRIVEDSQDSLTALSGVFLTDSATGEPVAANRRLAASWNEMCLYMRRVRPETVSYRTSLRRALGLSPAGHYRDPFQITNPLMI